MSHVTCDLPDEFFDAFQRLGPNDALPPLHETDPLRVAPGVGKHKEALRRNAKDEQYYEFKWVRNKHKFRQRQRTHHAGQLHELFVPHGDEPKWRDVVIERAVFVPVQGTQRGTWVPYTM